MTDERKALYWLSICGLSAKKQNELLERYGSGCKVHSNLNDKALIDFAGKNHEVMKRYADENYITEKLYELNRKGVKVLVRSMPEYPERLAQSEVVPPLTLYYRGNINLLAEDAVAVVGTRKSDEYGKDATKFIVSKLAAKLTVITGHATGIDNYAAKYALAAGGSVIIVAASGFATLTVPDFIKKADGERVLIITEYEPDVKANEFTFPVRNRLISGLSCGVAVVQAPEKSGALITANFAAHQGRTVYAVPGSIVSAKCHGSNELIASGATVLTDAQVIFDDFGISAKEVAAAEPNKLQATGDEQLICEFLGAGRKNIDDIVRQVNKPPHEVIALLSSMEMKGLIKKKISNYYEI